MTVETESVGSRWMEIDGAVDGIGPVYPSDGIGGVTATATSSELHGVAEIIIDRLIIFRTASGTDNYVRIVDAAGATILEYDTTSSHAGYRSVALGIRYPGNVGLLLEATADEAILTYRIVRR